MLTANEIRDSFKSFFESKGHQIVPSAPMVIKDDPTLMFTNAGMNQFKDIILGNHPAKYKRVADSLTQLLALTSHVKTTFQSPQPFEELLGTHLLLDALIQDYTAIKNNYLVNDYEENLIELNTLKAAYSAKIDQLNTQEQTLLDNMNCFS